ncbi:dATP/dGTP diphosphohydrolase domain-containing protein [Mesorhizobium sp. STM 4661]|uniref:dATP/dGTP diphosphohydrolase domain-containing protein n=1 Tax=Mesorhizobium sp. STM 4661 TaxID=1297570 RepID=UPI0002BF0A02|nr:dATP/dGTP diphosphohydrolase domain-containing protein [Mesorhizobium sp. STM 4661]CCV12908.1 hypothetical protein MESS4_510075 [Mesorhizobium sp. STM 4661]
MAMLRYNAGKPPLTLVPTALIMTVAAGWEGDFFRTPTLMIEDVARVLDFGQKKYSAHNWRKGGSWCAVLDCAMRHMNKIARGETHDDESGLHHYAHVGCNIAFLLEFIEQKVGDNDRHRLAIRKPRPGFGDEPFNNLYSELLAWKDGDDFALDSAAIILARHYEELNPGIVPGTSPHAHVQFPLPVLSMVSEHVLRKSTVEAITKSMPIIGDRNTTL